MKLAVSLILLMVPVSFFACSSIDERIGKDPFDLHGPSESPQAREEAQRLIETLKRHNAGLQTFKGLGKIQLWNKNETFTSRLAWIGNMPEKLRMELLGLYGQPATSFAADGNYFYFYSHLEDRYYKRRLTDTSLKPILALPLQLSDVLDLLAGRVSIRDYRLAKVIKNTSGEGYILIVLLKKSGIVVKLYLSHDKMSVWMTEHYRSNGSLLYRAIFKNTKRVQSYLIPFSLSVSDDNGTGFKLDIERFWVDVTVKPSVFVLPHPG